MVPTFQRPRSAGDTGQPGRHGQRLLVAVTVIDDALALAVDGAELLRWRHREALLLHGQIGLANGPGCHTRWERVAVRGLGGNAGTREPWDTSPGAPQGKVVC